MSSRRHRPAVEAERVPDRSGAGAPEGAGLEASRRRLRAAATLLLDEWATRGPEGVAVESLASAVEVLALAVEEALATGSGGQRPAATLHEQRMPVAVATFRLVDRLESAVADVLSGVERSALDGTDVLAIMRAFAEVRSRLWRDHAQRFAARISGPDAGEVLVALAHDMRSTLGSILFLSDHLRGGGSGPLTQHQSRQLGLVYSAAFALSGVVNDVMGLARDGGRLLEKSPVSVDVVAMVRQVSDMVRPVAEERGVALEIGTMPAGLRLGHPAALQRVLLNLLTNAVKFTDEGVVRLDATASDGAGTVWWTVSDTGRGIPPAVLAVLREPFRPQGGKAETQFSSAGLGLAMTQRLLELQGSTLEIESEEGRGTRFSFVLSLPPATAP